jgi:DNA invertase Pin-like site-specific DNA recombinase
LIAEYEEVESGKNSDRPELAKAIAFAKKARARLVIAKLDRLSRNVAFIATLLEKRVDFVAVDNPHATKFNMQILAVIAEWERDAISRGTREALAAAKARGIVKNGPNAGKPLRLGNYARISKAKQAATKARAETVRLAIESTAHLSANAAAIALNERDVTTAAGGSWRAEQVLRARRHLGV